MLEKVNNRRLGAYGEELAAQLAENKGLIILQRNFLCRQGEIDLIARDGATLVFIEVKTRKSMRFGYPEEAVDYRKQQKIRSVAGYYVTSVLRQNLPCRFDVYALSLDGENQMDSYRIYENCF